MSTATEQGASPQAETEKRRERVAQFGSEARWYETIQNALVITRREVQDSFRDWRIMFPIIVLTLFFPILANIASQLFINLFERYGAEADDLIEAFLPLMPMIVGFFPVSISLVIALETFVGEKERRSLEPLLSTPLTNTELYMGKVIAAMIPPLVAGYLGITLYLSGLILGAQQWRPDPDLILLILVLTAIQGAVMVTGAVVISSQTTSTRAANLLASAIILPMSLLVILESIIMIQPGIRHALWYVAIGLVVVVILFVRTGTRIFNREELLGRAIDSLNLRWAWRIIVEQYTGISHEDRLAAQRGDKPLPTFNLVRWYRRTVFPTIKTLRNPMLAVMVAVVGAFVVGWILSSELPLPLDEQDYSNEDLMTALRDIWEQAARDPKFVLLPVIQNVRVIVAMGFLGLFTFGVLALQVVILPFGLLGYIFGNLAASGISATPFILAIVTHGIVEIPAIMIGTAAALRAGSIITRPPDEMTVGEAWLRAIGDGLKIGIAVVLPLLFIAGLLEVYVTPRVVEFALELGF
ncbi:MAG: ABC transporter permease subunit [Chloroflexi bacterium]|nr:ABC transporter permease subunit [Chloroflexota bacterium]